MCYNLLFQKLFKLCHTKTLEYQVSLKFQTITFKIIFRLCLSKYNLTQLGARLNGYDIYAFMYFVNRHWVHDSTDLIQFFRNLQLYPQAVMISNNALVTRKLSVFTTLDKYTSLGQCGWLGTMLKHFNRQLFIRKCFFMVKMCQVDEVGTGMWVDVNGY